MRLALLVIALCISTPAALQAKSRRDYTFADGEFSIATLAEAHPLARPAAEIAEAAATLRQFWPMHDWLYENQDEWSSYGPQGLEAGLQALGIDEATVARAIREPSIDARINADFAGGVRSGVNGTPCFFINGYRYGGGADSLERAIKDMIQRL